MDGDNHELRNYGCCGIYKYSFHLILKEKKIFTQITLAIILPLSIIFLAYIQVAEVLHLYKNNVGYAVAVAFIFNMVLILSMAVVFYTVGCIYVAKHTTFKVVIGAMPKVWKRLIVTFLWDFLVFILLSGVAVAVVAIVWNVLYHVIASVDHVQTFMYVLGITIIILILLFIVGFVYLAMIWQLDIVVSVLEDVYGRKAMAKGRKLVKGKMIAAIGCSVGLAVMVMFVTVLLEYFVVTGRMILAVRILIGIVCGVLYAMLLLYRSVVQTVLYLVCKAYHLESIDRLALSAHLEAFAGDYVTQNRDIQLQQV